MNPKSFGFLPLRWIVMARATSRTFTVPHQPADENLHLRVVLQVIRDGREMFLAAKRTDATQGGRLRIDLRGLLLFQGLRHQVRTLLELVLAERPDAVVDRVLIHPGFEVVEEHLAIACSGLLIAELIGEHRLRVQIRQHPVGLHGLVGRLGRREEHTTQLAAFIAVGR